MTNFTCIECENHYTPNVDGDADERMCDNCLSEKEYSVTVTASFGVIAESQKDADNYILQQFYEGNRAYTDNVEVSNE